MVKPCLIVIIQLHSASLHTARLAQAEAQYRKAFAAVDAFLRAENASTPVSGQRVVCCVVFNSWFAGHLGVDSPERYLSAVVVPFLRMKIAHCLQEQGKLSAAEDELLEAMKIVVALYGNMSAYVVGVGRQLAYLYHVMERPQCASVSVCAVLCWFSSEDCSRAQLRRAC